MSVYKTLFTKSDFHQDTQNFFKNKKVVITGGSGFIGSHLVEQLLELGAKPIVLFPDKRVPYILKTLLF